MRTLRWALPALLPLLAAACGAPPASTLPLPGLRQTVAVPAYPHSRAIRAPALAWPSLPPCPPREPAAGDCALAGLRAPAPTWQVEPWYQSAYARLGYISDGTGGDHNASVFTVQDPADTDILVSAYLVPGRRATLVLIQASYWPPGPSLE